ncbi:hypothetical protein CEF21_01885 [Bacillus sp. FJAT-42376]|uniref:hypothetical protein n=1 Tax=Bacillus sp. FJAT-42376 TaxID=2014076 RepID=UPI000F4E0E35|nr:hypothetical protein [Bacillus sp. FJAT-42376]AZB41180.1 hypothetical protein CEF21_01885 [Bacillus sp. FJAT-42376]
MSGIVVQHRSKMWPCPGTTSGINPKNGHVRDHCPASTQNIAMSGNNVRHQSKKRPCPGSLSDITPKCGDVREQRPASIQKTAMSGIIVRHRQADQGTAKKPDHSGF